jgi:hypothetical protein
MLPHPTTVMISIMTVEYAEVAAAGYWVVSASPRTDAATPVTSATGGSIPSLASKLRSGVEPTETTSPVGSWRDSGPYRPPR